MSDSSGATDKAPRTLRDVEEMSRVGEPYVRVRACEALEEGADVAELDILGGLVEGCYTTIQAQSDAQIGHRERCARVGCGQEVVNESLWSSTCGPST